MRRSHRGAEFIERMEFKYGPVAAASGAHMASACGFDSIPGDLGTVLAQRQFPAPGVSPRKLVGELRRWRL